MNNHTAAVATIVSAMSLIQLLTSLLHSYSLESPAGALVQQTKNSISQVAPPVHASPMLLTHDQSLNNSQHNTGYTNAGLNTERTGVVLRCFQFSFNFAHPTIKHSAICSSMHAQTCSAEHDPAKLVWAHALPFTLDTPLSQTPLSPPL